MVIEITALVQSAGGGDATARNTLFAVLYDELERVARKQLRGSSSPTLDTTSLVHDAYLKLAAPGNLNLQGRKHFFVVVAKAMRQVVIDHARARAADKRGGGSLRASSHRMRRSPTGAGMHAHVCAMRTEYRPRRKMK